MSDILRDRIAAVLKVHAYNEWDQISGSPQTDCECGQAVTDYEDHVAGAVIAALGLREEVKYPGVVSSETPQLHRYVTDWESE